jgi:hypothetical protein
VFRSALGPSFDRSDVEWVRFVSDQYLLVLTDRLIQRFGVKSTITSIDGWPNLSSDLRTSTLTAPSSTRSSVSRRAGTISLGADVEDHSPARAARVRVYLDCVRLDTPPSPLSQNRGKHDRYRGRERVRRVKKHRRTDWNRATGQAFITKSATQGRDVSHRAAHGTNRSASSGPAFRPKMTG